MTIRWPRAWVGGCLCAALALAGCGEGSGGASKPTPTAAAGAAPSTTTSASTPTASTPAHTSTAGKPTSSKPATTATTPANTASTPAKPSATGTTRSPAPARSEPTIGRIKVTSAAFSTGGPIAAKYTCDGAGTSPPLQWNGVPHGTSEVFLLAIDLTGSAGDEVQWAVAGIPPTTTSIPEGALPAGAVAGRNSAGKIGWGGVCGAKGQLHHVGFLLYALDHKLGLKSGFNPVEVRKGLTGKLATGLTLATYQRP
jgi:Raf kinase inhibitor-like YbhB/YbcL family protein